MKRILFVASFVTAIAVATALAAPPGGKTVGNFENTTTGGLAAKRHVEAQGGPTDKGHVMATVVDPSTSVEVRQFQGDVDCYFQDANRSRVSGVITKSRGEQEVEGQYFLWTLEDNGKKSGDPPDRFRADRSNSPYDCTVASLLPTQPVEKGDIKIDPPK